MEDPFVGSQDLMQLAPEAISKMAIPLYLGKDASGEPLITDLTGMPHLLIAGATGSGKSVCLNALIVSLLYKATAENIRLLLIDPKRVELSVYDGIPHLAERVVCDPKEAAKRLGLGDLVDCFFCLSIWTAMPVADLPRSSTSRPITLPRAMRSRIGSRADSAPCVSSNPKPSNS